MKSGRDNREEDGDDKMSRMFILGVILKVMRKLKLTRIMIEVIVTIFIN